MIAAVAAIWLDCGERHLRLLQQRLNWGQFIIDMCGHVYLWRVGILDVIFIVLYTRWMACKWLWYLLIKDLRGNISHTLIGVLLSLFYKKLSLFLKMLWLLLISVYLHCGYAILHGTVLKLLWLNLILAESHILVNLMLFIRGRFKMLLLIHRWMLILILR